MRKRKALLGFALAAILAAPMVAQQAPAPPKPSAETKKMGVMIGKFTNEGEMVAGAMGPNSPAQKATGTDDCRWVSGGFAVLCTSTFDMAGMKGTETALIYYDENDKKYHYHAVSSAGDVDDARGTVDGNTWTWTGDSFMSGKMQKTKFTMKVNSKDSYEYSVEAGDNEGSMKPMMTGKDTRVTVPAKPKQ